MSHFTIDEKIIGSESLPLFTLTINDSQATSIYSDGDLQAELVNTLRRNTNIPIFDLQEGLYMRLSVEDNIAFFLKWFNCKMPLPKILVEFELHTCAKKALDKCSESEIRRVYFAKYFISGYKKMVFQEPIHGVDVITVNNFINMLQKIKDLQIPVLILVSSMEHAVLLGDRVYKLKQDGLQEVEADEGEVEDTSIQSELESPRGPVAANLFKIPARVGDKMILFDPTEIDYIESQDGKTMIMINEESYAMEDTLAEANKKLEVFGFYRCHRSYIVNLQKVREIITWSKNSYSLRISNKVQSTIPLSRSKIQDIQEKLNLK
ncbi:response regulator transcription factor [Jeotgalibacillus sp. R-1-5s-1]|uniref:response regulator transcription factor n=1 Tax=Jeotgalibacillus sp. R-1-5s-1 TaxID=2555897 RepID=UPI00106D0B56|nr:response regulator transcription factor [Jeotgalibacillus sp. R-1-5s-1]TFD93651.1 LytR family transcriptional regulator [Jeotgalibacillus sp. R-1-5s-1]